MLIDKSLDSILACFEFLLSQDFFGSSFDINKRGKTHLNFHVNTRVFPWNRNIYVCRDLLMLKLSRNRIYHKGFRGFLCIPDMLRMLNKEL